MRKRVLISGASSGIGKKTAQVFLREGFDLILLGRNRNRLDESAKQAQILGQGQVETFVFDLLEETYPKDLWACRPDVLLLNAGLFEMDSAFPVPEVNQARRLLEVNYLASLRLLDGLLPNLIEQKGQVIFISSVAGKRGLENLAAYSASKHALTGFVRAIRPKLLEQGVKVSIVFPGSTDTPSWDAGEVDVQALADPSDVAQAVFGLTQMGNRTQIDEIEIQPTKSFYRR